MKTLIRSALVAVTLIGTVSAVSAAPHKTYHHSYDNSYNTGAIADFDRFAHTED